MIETPCLAAAEDDDDGDEPELPHAASSASGNTAAAAHTVRILLPTEEYSFVSARWNVRYTTRTRRVR
jgi:hypothetical protein